MFDHIYIYIHANVYKMLNCIFVKFIRYFYLTYTRYNCYIVIIKSIINILAVKKQCLISNLTLNIVRREEQVINCYCLRTILYRVI